MNTVFSHILTSCRMLIITTLLLGGAYPLMVYGIGQVLFPSEAGGSLVYKEGQVIGSTLIAQKWTGPGFFRSRPSAGDFQTVASGASNFGATSASLESAVQSKFISEGLNARAASSLAVSELVTASGSGLDPDLSLDAIRLQQDRVVRERHLDQDQQVKLSEIIDSVSESPKFGFLGPKRVNVLKLNLALGTLELP